MVTESKAPTRANSLAFSTSSKIEDEPYNKGEIHFWRNFGYEPEVRVNLEIKTMQLEGRQPSLNSFGNSYKNYLGVSNIFRE